MTGQCFIFWLDNYLYTVITHSECLTKFEFKEIVQIIKSALNSLIR